MDPPWPGRATRQWGQACISVRQSHSSPDGLTASPPSRVELRGGRGCSTRPEWGLEPISAPGAKQETRSMLDEHRQMGERGRPPRVGGNDHRRCSRHCRAARARTPAPEVGFAASRETPSRAQAVRDSHRRTLTRPRLHAVLRTVDTQGSNREQSRDRRLAPYLTHGGPAIQRLLFVADAAVADVGQLPPPVRAVIDAAAAVFVLTPTLPGRLAWLADEVDRGPACRR